jgi:hypothetical protein
VVSEHKVIGDGSNGLEHFGWLGSIPYNVAETYDYVDTLRADIRKHCFPRSDVCVDV